MNNKQINVIMNARVKLEKKKKRFLGDNVKKIEQKNLQVCLTFEPNYDNF